MTLDRVTARDIETAVFTATRFRQGYSESEVDDLLDAAADTLTVHQRNAEEIRGICGRAIRANVNSGPLNPTLRLALAIHSILDEPDYDADDPDTDDGEAVA